MASSSTDTIDLASTLEVALDCASSGLRQAAIDLGAVAVAVLIINETQAGNGTQAEITHFGNSLSDGAPNPQLVDLRAEDQRAVSATSGPVHAESPLAQLLRKIVASSAQSFLLFPSKIRQRIITVVFAFTAAAPPDHEVSEGVKNNLNLVGLATWSVKEIARLRGELKTANSRLAGRKLVERAKGVLQLEQGVSEEKAYEYLRGRSRSRRITLAAVAEEILKKRGTYEASP